MTTIVAVKKNGHVAIGADTMTKLGYLYERAEYVENHSKLLKFGENYFACSGHASFTLILTSYFAKIKAKTTLDTPQAIFEFARALHGTLKDDYFLKPDDDKDDAFESSRMCCLIANPYGIFGLYDLRSVQQYTKFYAFGSGYEFALGAMRAVYSTDLDAQAIARTGLEAAADFDDATGLPVEIYTIELDVQQRR